MKFEWQTEEERKTGWENAGERVPASAWHRSCWPFAVFLLLALAGGLVWREATQRVAAVELAVREEVLSSHKLAQQASAEQDRELFISLLSGRDPGWTAAQKDGLEKGLLFAAAAHPFDMQSLPRDDQDEEITLDPGLNEAVVVVTHPYVVTATHGLTRTIELQQTHVYRRGPRRWLLAPPEPEFWGEWRYFEGAQLTVAYRQRDEALVQRLATDINHKLTEMCRTLPGLDCPPDFRVHLRLSDDPATLLAAADLRGALESGRDLALPTPTLVGLPLDDAGYQALFHGYAVHIIAGALTDLVGYECCRGDLFFQTLLEEQWHRLNLRPWATGQDEYERTLEPLSLPGADIQASCSDNSGAVKLMHYDVHSERWSQSLEYEPGRTVTPPDYFFNNIVPLPQDYGHLVQEVIMRGGEQVEERLVWLQEGHSVVLSLAAEEGNDHQLLLAGVAPMGRYLAVTRREARGDSYWLLDLAQCDDGRCAGQRLLARPIWSPDGRYTLFESRAAGVLLFRGNEVGQEVITLKDGRLPFWLGTAHYGYLRTVENSAEAQLMVAAVSDDRPRVLGGSSDFLAAIPENDRPETLHLLYAQANPADPTQLLVHGRGSKERAYLFRLRLTEALTSLREISLLHASDGFPYFWFSPAGRWLAVHQWAGGETHNLLLYPSSSNSSYRQLITLPPYCGMVGWAE